MDIMVPFCNLPVALNVLDLVGGFLCITGRTPSGIVLPEFLPDGHQALQQESIINLQSIQIPLKTV